MSTPKSLPLTSGEASGIQLREQWAGKRDLSLLSGDSAAAPLIEDWRVGVVAQRPHYFCDSLCLLIETPGSPQAAGTNRYRQCSFHRRSVLSHSSDVSRSSRPQCQQSWVLSMTL